MNNIIEELMKKTKKSENECKTIAEVLNNHFIIGHNNKKKIISDFEKKLSITKEEADNLYNDVSSIIVSNILKRNK